MLTTIMRTVELTLCELCLGGAGGECHVPGCALYLSRAPDLRIHPELYNVVFEWLDYEDDDNDPVWNWAWRVELALQFADHVDFARDLRKELGLTV